jgi:hypothetical protein
MWDKHGPLVGRMFTKLPNGRKAQVSAVVACSEGIFAVMYWPDRNTETRVQVDRLVPHHHWAMCS